MKNKIMIILCAILFGAVGVYLTIFSSNTSKYDSNVKAFQIDENEKYESDGYIYRPVYYYKVDGNEYQCESKNGSSTSPNKKKNIVYYDSKNPEKCLTQYDASSSKFGGIICIVVAFVILILLFKKTPDNVSTNQENVITDDQQRIINENIEKAEVIIDKVSFTIKRIIIGIIIFILLILCIFDLLMIKQTLDAKDYIDTTAVFVEERESSDSEMLKDCVYSFVDKNGNKQEIVVSLFKDNQVENEIKIKYNEKNPQDYYEEDQTYDKNGIIWFIVKIVVIILLVILFFNKKLLSKVRFSVGSN